MLVRKRDLLGLAVSDEVILAQVRALKHRVPVLYLILSINVVALAFTHRATCPPWQSVYVPVGIVLTMIIRMVWWLRLRGAALDVPSARQARRKTINLGGILGLATLAWSMSLYSNGRSHEWAGRITGDGHVAFFVGITVVSCIFLLMHVRAAAILLTTIIVLPFAAYLASTGQLIECALALNLILVAAGMLYVAALVSLDFERMITTAADLQAVSAQNAKLAAADAVTGLPNRRSFWAELDSSTSSGQRSALMIIDLDGFKQVNDLYGHLVGDEVLIVIAKRIRDVFPVGSIVARMGGDEFACLLYGSAIDEAERFAVAAIEACSQPIVLPAITAHVGASIGIALPEMTNGGSSKAYERADYALYKAKRLGKGRVELFTDRDGGLQHREFCVAHAMRSPTFLSELFLAYQPIVDSSNGTVAACEALVRWHSAELGPVAPNEFIFVAERTDLIFEITNFVLNQALTDALHWPDSVCLKINLSVRDLMSAKQTARLMQVVRHSHIAPDRITFEITESIFADSLAQVRANVDVIRMTGCAVAIDDFGVGYSSLNYIHALAPDVIKIDRCFVEDVVNNHSSQRIVRTIIELARNVGARSVAEGVEDAAQATTLIELGCDELQGYFFSKPISAKDAVRFVADFNMTSDRPLSTAA